LKRAAAGEPPREIALFYAFGDYVDLRAPKWT
jgi:hypothetical protein